MDWQIKKFEYVHSLSLFVPSKTYYHADNNIAEQPITNNKFVAVLFLLIDTVLLYLIQFKLEIKKNIQ